MAAGGFYKSNAFAVTLAIAVAIVLLAPKPLYAGGRGYVPGAIIGGIAAAIIAAEAAKAGRAGYPKSKKTAVRKKKARENANASVDNNSGDPFAGVTPTRIRPVHKN